MPKQIKLSECCSHPLKTWVDYLPPEKADCSHHPHAKLTSQVQKSMASGPLLYGGIYNRIFEPSKANWSAGVRRDSQIATALNPLVTGGQGQLWTGGVEVLMHPSCVRIRSYLTTAMWLFLSSCMNSYTGNWFFSHIGKVFSKFY